MTNVPERSAEEILAYCQPILNRRDLIELVEKSSGTNAARAMVFIATNDEKLANAGRWLAVLRNKYPQEYQKVVTQSSSNHSQVNATRRESDDNQAV